MSQNPEKNIFAARPWACLAVSATGTFMATLDGGIVNVGLPTIAHGFGADLPFAQWVITVYLLVIACLLPAFGRLGDMRGRRSLYGAGFFLFTLASAVCGLAPGIWWLIGGRALQGVGAAMLMANGPAIVVQSFPGPERGRALGMIGMVVSLGSLAGPSLGGLLVGAFGWPSIFYVTVPVGILGMVLSSRVLPDDRRPVAQSFDFAGAAFYAVGIVFLLVAITHGGRWGWVSPGTLACAGTAALGIWLFLRRQARVEHPLVDLALFRIRALLVGNIASLLAFMSMLTNAVMLPFFLVRVCGFSSQKAGLIMAAMPLAMTFVAPVSGLLSEKTSHALLTGLGMGLTAAGLWSHTLLVPDSSLLRCVAGQAVLGVGMGLFLSPNNNAVLGSAPREKSGVAGSVMALVRNLGMVSGIALATAVYEAFHTRALAAGQTETAAFVAGFDASLACAAALALAAALLGATRPASQVRRPTG
ncbi:MAG: DHA2 family efflux MFS transporter permease subunit [Acidobacteriota bacterium]